MRFRLVFSVVALMCVFFGLAQFGPMLTDLYFNNTRSALLFASSAIFTFSISTLAYWMLRPKQDVPLRTKEMFLTTTLIWLIYSILGALPIYLSVSNLSCVDAFFESMSGLTTTGATILSGLDTMSRGLLMWRAMLQWLGGIGVILIAVTILPTLRIGGMQFFTTEFSGDAMRQSPTVLQTMHMILTVFITLTLFCTLCLKSAGMNWFDALAHAMTTIATGGFSTHDASIAFYDSPVIEWVLIAFMFLAGLPLVIWIQLCKRQFFLIRQNAQVKTYIHFLLIALGVLLVGRWLGGTLLTDNTFRSSLFSLLSVITTTGFIGENYALWGSFSVLFFLFLISVGSCAGSTSGGIKMFRFAIMGRQISSRLKASVQPHAIVVPRYGNRPISEEVSSSVLFFIGIYLVTVCVGALLLSLTGLDIITSLSGSLSAIANVGPGLGNNIGPDMTFAGLPDMAKILMSFMMLLGRLEFITVIILFVPFLWRRNI
jgi:trk system potassium uptake protein TrkH